MKSYTIFGSYNLTSGQPYAEPYYVFRADRCEWKTDDVGLRVLAYSGDSDLVIAGTWPPGFFLVQDSDPVSGRIEAPEQEVHNVAQIPIGENDIVNKLLPHLVSAFDNRKKYAKDYDLNHFLSGRLPNTYADPSHSGVHPNSTAILLHNEGEPLLCGIISRLDCLVITDGQVSIMDGTLFDQMFVNVRESITPHFPDRYYSEQFYVPRGFFETQIEPLLPPRS